MVNFQPLRRIAAGQSPNETSVAFQNGSATQKTSALIVSMSFTIIVAAALLPGSVRAQDAVPHVTAVAVARAQVVSGVRISREQMELDQESAARKTRLPKPRERPCPETDEHPCRLIVVDMP